MVIMSFIHAVNRHNCVIRIASFHDNTQTPETYSRLGGRVKLTLGDDVHYNKYTCYTLDKASCEESNTSRLLPYDGLNAHLSPVLLATPYVIMSVPNDSGLDLLFRPGRLMLRIRSPPAPDSLSKAA